ncbi:ead/Ea22-like family protein [Enterobacter hormaechei]|uniref:ead/Ea22-like family protein n=1 Tax=Enterobacter hormaechei TaxID=158836 RepID=UPI0031DF00A0
MSNIDKQALRNLAVAAKLAPSWYAVGEFGDVVDPAKPEWKPVHEFCKTFTAARVLALLDELEAKDKSISFLKDQLAQLANFNPDWDKLEAATYSLREHMAELTAARKRIAELNEALKQAVSGYKSCLRTGYERILELGGDCDSPEVMIAGNPDIQHAEKLIVAAAGKGEAS